VFEPELERSWLECRGATNELFETLTGQRLRVASGAARPSLLLDMRNVRATFNGTTFAAIGAAWGLYQADCGWDVSVLAHPDGAPFHDFGSMFPGWRVCTSPPAATFTAALRLSQPWHIQEMVDLHLAARVNAYLMLDTIAWDVQYVAPLRLDGTWRFLAASADGLLFISRFSEHRFCARFPRAERTARAVCHLSFAPDDYTRPELVDAPQEDYILVVGNDLDHKDVRATVGAIASAFPFERIEALGPSPVRSPRITTHKSGNLADRDVHRLYASAKIVVFPSFYEGFGFPVVTSLAYGRTLLARESALLHEVATRCSPRGRLIGYQQRDDVIDTIARLLHGERVPEIPVGADINGEGPRSWRQVGLELDEFLRALTSTVTSGAWRARDELVNHALAYRT
jgi:glycosyltransferase involved in cell wall biosynthesis